MIIIPGKKKNLSKRYYANVIDYLIIMILVVIFLVVFGEQYESGTYRVVGLKALFVPVVWFLYFPVCESAFGRTLGKRMFNLYVLGSKGRSPSIFQAFVRRVLDPIEIIFLGVPALLVINFSSKNQRVGDMMADTIVIITDAACGFCGTELELSPKEVFNDVFICPNCGQTN